MNLKEKIDAGLKIFVLVLLTFLLAAPLLYLHSKIVDILAELAAKIAKYLLQAP